MMIILSAHRISPIPTGRDLWLFRLPWETVWKGPLKGFGHALLLVDVQSRITDFIAVSVGGVPDEFRNERAAVHVAVA